MSIIYYFKNCNKCLGKWAGIISTARITHATPAAAFAHSPDRDWETDGDIPEDDRDECLDIATQLIHNEDNKDIRVGYKIY